MEKGGDSPDNLHGAIVLLVVDAHDEHRSVGTGSGDHHPLSTASQMSLRNTKEVRGQRKNFMIFLSFELRLEMM